VPLVEKAIGGVPKLPMASATHPAQSSVSVLLKLPNPNSTLEATTAWAAGRPYRSPSASDTAIDRFLFISVPWC
jgi:hypothetical protein